MISSWSDRNIDANSDNEKMYNYFGFILTLFQACEMYCHSAVNNVCTVCTAKFKYILSLLNARPVLKAYRYEQS